MNFFFKWSRTILRRFTDVCLCVYVFLSSFAAFLGNHQTSRDHEISCLLWHTPIGPTLLGFTWFHLAFLCLLSDERKYSNVKKMTKKKLFYIYSWLFLIYNIFWYLFNQFFGIRIYFDICLFNFWAPEYVLIFLWTHFMCYFTICWPLLTYFSNVGSI